jgi:uncharacterized protein (DUF1501 family)
MNARQILTLRRRQFLTSTAGGIGFVALASLLSEQRGARAQVASKAKSCIFFFMEGGPSQFDLFSNKPKLVELNGQPPPADFLKDARFAFIKKETARLRGSPRTFKQYGQSGLWLSDLLPQLALQADRLCLLQAVHTSQFNHNPAQLLMQTGNNLPGHPSAGAWLSYGLGKSNEDLPSYLVLNSARALTGGASLWGSGFIPSANAGVLLQAEGDPVLNLERPEGLSADAEAAELATLSRLNGLHAQSASAEAAAAPVLDARTTEYELAFGMQRQVPELMDLSDETPATLERYGVGRDDLPATLPPDLAPPAGVFSRFARQCLLARRLVEKGVRFVNVFSGTWDHHENVDLHMPYFASLVDQPIAALLGDLAERGLLDETLVVFAGEFGRTPLSEDGRPSGSTGRDHHPDAFPILMAGGGLKAGFSYGSTDELGWRAAEGGVDISDFHATLLHLFGIDHTSLTYEHDGLAQRLTPVTRESRVIEGILA